MRSLRLVSNKIKTAQHLLGTTCPSPMNIRVVFSDDWFMEDMENRSPKGNTWSAIPVALLCMVVNRNERQGSGPEGDEVL